MERLQEITRGIALQDIKTLYQHTAFWMEQNDLTQIVNAYFDLKQAEAEGLLLRLPCKVGDKVKVDARTWGNSWDFKTIEYGKFLVGEIISIVRTKKQTLMKIQVEHNVSWKRERKRYPVSAIGATVFLIEDGKTALKGGDNSDED